MVRKGHGRNWKREREQKFTPNISYYHLHSQPYFTRAKGVFKVISAPKAGGNEKKHFVIVALRRIAREEHETVAGLKHVHSENLGGEHGEYAAHVYESSGQDEKHKHDYYWICKNEKELLHQFNQWFTRSRVPVEHLELKRIVGRIV